MSSLHERERQLTETDWSPFVRAIGWPHDALDCSDVDEPVRVIARRPGALGRIARGQAC
jgi:hypothetical protein